MAVLPSDQAQSSETPWTLLSFMIHFQSTSQEEPHNLQDLVPKENASPLFESD